MTIKTFENQPNTALTASAESILPRDATIIMPVGGKATRALEVTQDSIPKHLIRLGDGRTVLDVICGELQRVGFRQFVFCVGHHKDQTMAHISREAWIDSPDTRYEFSEESVPLGVDGAVLQAIRSRRLQGQGVIVPGDIMLPWDAVAAMSVRHAERGADVTMGVTSRTTERTTDIGRLIVETQTDRLLWCHGRTEEPPLPPPGCRGLTSAAATTISTERYIDLYDAYVADDPARKDQPLSLRDRIAPWAIRTGEFEIQTYDVEGEILDMGTPANIQYGQDNWRHFV